MGDYIDFFNIKVNMSSKIDDWHDTLEHYNDEALDSIVEDTWAIIKQQDEMPIMANVIQSVMLDKLQQAIIDSIMKDNGIATDDVQMRDKLEEFITYEACSYTSNLSIDGVEVAELEEVQAAVKKLVKKLIK